MQSGGIVPECVRVCVRVCVCVCSGPALSATPFQTIQEPICLMRAQNAFKIGTHMYRNTDEIECLKAWKNMLLIMSKV